MKRALALAVAVAALALSGCTAAASPGGTAAPPTVTTRATGTVTGTPDLLTVTLGVVTRAGSATDALAANATAADDLLQVLRDGGVADADLRTSGLSIGPTYGDTGRITGYEVSNEVTATLRDLAAAGGLIDAAGRAVGDAVRVQRLEFSVDDDSAARADARADAVGRARAQAEQLAEAGGVALGPILSITEIVADRSPPVPFARDAAEQAATTPLLPGSQEIGVTVEVVHALG
ncbi:SIMPL domain-containing protein [Pseudonocardia sp.]|uniref:SIMPL domain-containing protein n=1 Tax=Pseudonocardia sp. TaxID=60912 RepID=UPI0026306DE3|nr:SIMPL domain-containing protein [Pseudonocardia sp.]